MPQTPDYGSQSNDIFYKILRDYFTVLLYRFLARMNN